MRMRLWIILRPDEEPPAYDVANGFVVRAESESAAREIASKNSGDEGRSVWLDPEKTTCVELMADGEPGCILVDFNAG